MSKFIKVFENHNGYEDYKTSQSYISPNVSFCRKENEVHFNPFVETRLVVTYNFTNVYPTYRYFFSYGKESFIDTMELDGVMLDSPERHYSEYDNNDHVVKYSFKNASVIPQGFFSGISGVIDITIPETITTINQDSLSTSGGPNSLFIPKSVTNIAIRAFGGNTFSRIVVEEGNSVYHSVDDRCIIETATNTLIYGFGDSSSMGYWQYPADVTRIEDYAFCSSYGGTFYRVAFGDSVTEVGEYAFAGNEIEGIKFGTGLTSIGDHAFGGTISYSNNVVYELILESVVPPSLGNQVFNSYSPNTIKVPAQSVEAYKAAPGWSDYASIITAIS